MLYQIIALLLEVIAGLLTSTCLLRLYMQYQRIPLSARSGNPLGRFIFALTDWLVLPLRRVLPAMGRWDTASLAGAFLVQLAEFAVLWALNGAGASLLSVAVLAVFGVLRTALSGMTVLVLVYAILSWVQTQSYLADLLERLVQPPLSPIRRVLPLVGGVDLSPLALLVLIQIAMIVLGSVQQTVLLAFRV
ncbi:YggT family protein [uncultured Rhodoferax sp.]|uniref:YggT family protein n=1 Tax=uncultured Rhodoferax sp. TaxID=223188 RepID=UPI0025FBB8C0|nr:YggT family protein [uncultured Rhodoferax sp.]